MPLYAICALLDELPTSSHFGSTVDMQTKAQPSVSVIRGPSAPHGSSCSCGDNFDSAHRYSPCCWHWMRRRVVITSPVPLSSVPFSRHLTAYGALAKWPLDTYSSDSAVFIGICAVFFKIQPSAQRGFAWGEEEGWNWQWSWNKF